MRPSFKARSLTCSASPRSPKAASLPIQQVDDQQATVGKETAAIEADNALIETAQINLGYCTIRAPFAGRVSLYQVDVGNLIQANGSFRHRLDRLRTSRSPWSSPCPRPNCPRCRMPA